jgi:putative redox protein
MREVTSETASGKLGQRVSVGPHSLMADEPKDEGGDDTGPSPHEFLLAALATCTSMTVKLYADRKAWPLRKVHIRTSGRTEGGVFWIERVLRVDGDLGPDQRSRLVEIAEKCPVARTLLGTIRIVTQLEGAERP